MDIKATKMVLETSDGDRGEFTVYKGITIPLALLEGAIDEDYGDHINEVLACPIRDDDVFLATYCKAGTHWAWEVINMVLRGSADYIKTDKESLFFELVSPKKMASCPSPRVLNSHFPSSLIPRSIAERGVKIVHVQRNVKDVIVSFYHMWKRLSYPFSKDMDTFIHHFTGSYGAYPMYSWVQYMLEWERFSKQHPDQILNISFEDMKEDPVREIKKINAFLQCECDEKTIGKIADACSFEKLKKADPAKTHNFNPPGDLMFRKGQVGDWKNWLTQAQSEFIDSWLADNMINTDLKFRYSL